MKPCRAVGRGAGCSVLPTPDVLVRISSPGQASAPPSSKLVNRYQSRLGEIKHWLVHRLARPNTNSNCHHDITKKFIECLAHPRPSLIFLPLPSSPSVIHCQRMQPAPRQTSSVVIVLAVAEQHQTLLLYRSANKFSVKFFYGTATIARVTISQAPTGD